jgi:hypothetical protein
MGEKAEDVLAEIRDTVENLLGAMKLPLPPEIHLEGLKENLEGVRDRICEFLPSEEGGE